MLLPHLTRADVDWHRLHDARERGIVSKWSFTKFYPKREPGEAPPPLIPNLRWDRAASLYAIAHYKLRLLEVDLVRYTKVGAIIKLGLHHYKITEGAAADYAEVCRETVSRIVGGRHPMLRTLYRLARVFPSGLQVIREPLYYDRFVAGATADAPARAAHDPTLRRPALLRRHAIEGTALAELAAEYGVDPIVAAAWWQQYLKDVPVLLELLKHLYEGADADPERALGGGAAAPQRARDRPPSSGVTTRAARLPSSKGLWKGPSGGLEPRELGFDRDSASH